MVESQNKLKNISAYFAKHRWPWHLLFWVYYIASRTYSYYLTILHYPKDLLVFMLLTEPTFVGLVYLTLWIYKQTSKLATILYGVTIWVIYLSIIANIQVHLLSSVAGFEEVTWTDSFFSNIELYILSFTLLFFAKSFKDSFIIQSNEEKRKKLLIANELQNLKAQISPHFLFNTLNNFYGLAVEKSDKLPDLMVRLSDLLRYSLYETKNITVPLENEISHLKNYISLEKIRLEDDLKLEFKTSILEGWNLQITPLLLIVPIENAFKHSKRNTNEPIYIKIDIKVSQYSELLLEVINNCSDSPTNKLEQGIGLENLKRRLEAFYPTPQHKLETRKEGNLFTSSIRISLNDNT